MWTCGQLRQFFDSPALSVRLKIRLYIAVVCSLIPFGSEAWELSTNACRRLNNTNSLMLSHITSFNHQTTTKMVGENSVERARHTKLQCRSTLYGEPGQSIYYLWMRPLTPQLQHYNNWSKTKHCGVNMFSLSDNWLTNVLVMNRRPSSDRSCAQIL